MLTYVYGWLALLNFYFLYVFIRLSMLALSNIYTVFSFVSLRLATLLTDITFFIILYMCATIDSISLAFPFAFLFVCYAAESKLLFNLFETGSCAFPN